MHQWKDSHRSFRRDDRQPWLWSFQNAGRRRYQSCPAWGPKAAEAINQIETKAILLCLRLSFDKRRLFPERLHISAKHACNREYTHSVRFDLGLTHAPTYIRVNSQYEDFDKSTAVQRRLQINTLVRVNDCRFAWNRVP
jgi:hypothetical protein